MPDDPAERPTILTVADGFFVRQAVDTIGWVELGGTAVVVDALEEAHLEEEVFAAIAETLGDVPVRYLVNTHCHGDHVALNAAFARRGAEIINQRAAPVGPEGRWLEGTRRRVQILPMPGCHTPEDVVVLSPEDRAIFVGDIFGWGLINLIGRLTDASAAGIVKTHEKVIAFDAATVICGHGPVCTTGELRRWVAYFRQLIADVVAAIAAGRTDDQIVADAAPPADMADWWRFRQWKHADSVSKVVRAVRAGHLTAPP